MRPRSSSSSRCAVHTPIHSMWRTVWPRPVGSFGWPPSAGGSHSPAQERREYMDCRNRAARTPNRAVVHLGWAPPIPGSLAAQGFCEREALGVRLRMRRTGGTRSFASVPEFSRPPGTEPSIRPPWVLATGKGVICPPVPRTSPSRDDPHEAHVSAECAATQEKARIPVQDADQGRARHHQAAQAQGPERSHRIAARGPSSRFDPDLASRTSIGPVSGTGSAGSWCCRLPVVTGHQRSGSSPAGRWGMP
jgi:hypothetical protein